MDEDDDGWGSGGSGGGGGGGGGGGRGGDDDKNERRESDDGLGLEEEEPEETVLQTLDVGLAPAPNPFINYLPKKAEKVAGLRSSIRWSAEQLPRILDHSAPADWKRNTSFGRWMERIRNSH